MAIIRHGNFAFQEPPFKDGDVIEGGNFFQLYPGTAICARVKNLTIKNGLFVNCVPQPTWKIEGGAWTQMDFCSHDRPDLIRRGLPVCPADCRHRQGDEQRWVQISENELREAKEAARRLEPTAPVVRIVETADADGIKSQEFEKQAYTYKSTRLGRSWRPAR